VTVGLGLVCKDGVIVASDSMGSSQMIATTSTKVFAYRNNPVVWTAAGAQYVIEEVTAAFETSVDNKANSQFTGPRPQELRASLTKTIHPTLQRCYQSALSTTPHPPGSTSTVMLTDILMLGYARGTPWFLEFAQDGQINWHTDARFYAVGSGGQFATVCHALMKHYVSDDLSLAEGLRLAYRAIETTYQVSAGFVGPPVQLAVADGDGARVLGEEEVNKVGLAVERWKVLESETLRMDEEPPPAEAEDDLPTIEPQAEEASGASAE
jgi:20S proteasome alpha/beta subunit